MRLRGDLNVSRARVQGMPVRAAGVRMLARLIGGLASRALGRSQAVRAPSEEDHREMLRRWGQ